MPQHIVRRSVFARIAVMARDALRSLHRVALVHRASLIRAARVHRAKRAGFAVFPSVASPQPSSLTLDIVVPAIEKDLPTLPWVIEQARKNLLHRVDSIFIVSPSSPKLRRLCGELRCTFVDENELLPDVLSRIDYVVDGVNRAGWMYQQFLKLSGDRICQHDNYLVVDADTLFVRPQTFERNGRFVFNFADEFHMPYRDVFERLLGFPAPCPVSLTSHHMLFNKSFLASLKQDIEMRNGASWHQSILSAVVKTESSGHSEYETYAQYVLSKHPDRFCLEYFHNISRSRDILSVLPEILPTLSRHYKSLSLHSYIRSSHGES